MFTVYINDTPLHFSTRTELPPDLNPDTHPVFVDMTGGKLISNCVDTLEKSKRFDAMYLVSRDPKKLFKFFKKKYKIIKAGGGIVKNEWGQILLIYRLKTYDLPKGKMEKGEKKKETAHREVEEETGVKSLITNDLNCITYHTYRSRKNNRILKKTFWYNMEAPNQKLTPQAEEDIEKAEWINPADLPQYYGNMYAAIRDILANQN